MDAKERDTLGWHKEREAGGSVHHECEICKRTTGASKAQYAHFFYADELRFYYLLVKELFLIPSLSHICLPGVLKPLNYLPDMSTSWILLLFAPLLHLCSLSECGISRL